MGQPAIVRLITTLQDSNEFDAICVSTDDDEIAEIAARAGATVPFKRPPELSDNFTGARPVIQHAVKTLDLDEASIVGVFYPTAVFLKPSDVRESLSLFLSAKIDFLLSVAAFPAPVSKALSMDEAGMVTPLVTKDHSFRTQDIAPSFHDLGQFYWGNARNWLGSDAVVNARTQGYTIEPWRAIDIDTPDDWLRAERMYRVLYGPE